MAFTRDMAASTETCMTTIFPSQLGIHEKSSQYYTKDKWDEYRDYISQLYQNEGKTLSEVRRAISDRFGFVAR